MKQKQQVISRFFAPKADLSESRSPALRPSPISAVQWPPARTSRSLQQRSSSPSPTKRTGASPAQKKRSISPSSPRVNEAEGIEVVDLTRPEFCSGAVSVGVVTDSEDVQSAAQHFDSNGAGVYKRRRRKESSAEEHPHPELLHEENTSGILLRTKESVVEECTHSDGTVREGPSSAYTGNIAKRGSSFSKSKESLQIPASDPARHQKFIKTLLISGDADRPSQVSKLSKGPSNDHYTPLEQQVVELKAKYKDVLLLVEVGYRYRMFGEDAEIAARVLGIYAYNDHNFITASIPTFRLHVHVRRLVEAGYKVGVVRQTETAAIKAHGGNKVGPFTRGLSALYTRATLEAAADLGGSETFTETVNCSKYLMCIAEQVNTLKSSAKSALHKQIGSVKADADTEASLGGAYDTTIGVIAVETATGDVMYAHFKDTVTRIELEGHLLACSPAELLLASPLASATEKLLVDYAGPSSNVRIERYSRESLGNGAALTEVLGFYESTEDIEFNQNGSKPEEKVDEGLEAIMAMPELVVQALVLALRHLKQFGLERILRLGATFQPFAKVCEMSLSSNTLQQLEILQNNSDGTSKGSLLWLMDHTHTPFGARLFHHWLLHPLRDEALILARLDAVSEIADSMGSVGGSLREGSFPGSGKGGGVAGALSRGRVEGLSEGSQGLLGVILMSLKKIPDVERGITRIFHGTATASEFVAVIQALLATVRQLQQICPDDEDETVMAESCEERPQMFQSPLLKRLFAAASSSAVSEHASRLLSSLSKEAASTGDKHNLFICGSGKFPMVEKCKAAVQAAELHLESLLPEYRKLLRISNLQYLSVSGNTHLIEVPAMQKVPPDWIKVCSTKKTNRYHSPDVLKALDVLALAKEELTVECNKAWQSFLADFASHYVDFRATVHALAALDCLYALAIVSRNQGYTRPTFVQNLPAELIIEGGRHPVLEATLQEGFVPNNTCLCADKERCQIITGPNMGGKSCYIRQVALIAIMAQVGSYVPAASVKLRAFDAIYTRMGASDSIQRGSSTFLEELSEASTILRRASPHSLVIMDELGRGTSTHDGVAIAYATLQYLLQDVRCLTLFVTHYPKIAELTQRFPGEVGAYHVAYLAEAPSNLLAVSNLPSKQASDKVDDDSSVMSEYQEKSEVSEAAHKITFLYKLVQGVASRSFGLHVARLAQIPEACIVKASVMALKLEKEIKSRSSSFENKASDYEAKDERNFTSTECIKGRDSGMEISEISEQLVSIFSTLRTPEDGFAAIKMVQEHVQLRLKG